MPALLDNAAHFALSEEDPYLVETKPHGHGDVHTLLYQSGLAAKWASEGRKWLAFFQDTNGQVFRALLAAIGVSVHKGLAVNSLTVPRRPGEAVGAICRLEGPDSSMTINVEYNQLDALMKASGIEDKVDEETGFSRFPGNINVLIFDVQSYSKVVPILVLLSSGGFSDAEILAVVVQQSPLSRISAFAYLIFRFLQVLEKTKGVISEFVNPKYSDPDKTKFQKPTRLECMMQDYPKMLDPSGRRCIRLYLNNRV